MARTTVSGGVLGAVVGALLGVPLSIAVVQEARARTSQVFTPVPVLAAAREVAAGVPLTDADVIETTFPAPLVTPSCATPSTRAQFVGKPVRWRVNAGAVLRDTDLIDADAACAARVSLALAQLDGGTPETRALGSALLERHGGAR